MTSLHGGGANAGALASRLESALRLAPIIGIHILCLGGIWIPPSATALATCVALYLLRMFAITAFYHRYFSHKSYATSRVMQFLFALCGATATQSSALWWASHHRAHHQHADQPDDIHSPVQHGFWRSQLTWYCHPAVREPAWERLKDWRKYPELVWLHQHELLVPILLSTAMFLLGLSLSRWMPGLGVDGVQLVLWGYVISTVILLHATSTINSLSHMIGGRPFATKDASRNHPLLAVITLGEGWHNNHHRFPAAAQQGIRWWQFDPTWWGLRIMERLGLIWDLRPMPKRIQEEARLGPARTDARRAATGPEGD